MKLVFRAISVLSLVILLSLGFGRAQTSGNASIIGVVTDASGAVLPGATVEASSPALPDQTRTATTDNAGRYSLLSLRPGTYNLKISLPGFATFSSTGIALTPNYTATINAGLKVGDVTQEVSVNADTIPMVDTANVTNQNTISRQTLTVVPTSNSALGIASLMPAVVEPVAAQDVGGTKGETSVRISVHGSKTQDARLRQEGMIYNALTPATAGSYGAGGGLEGTGRGYYVDPIALETIVVDSGTMGSGEYGVGGAQTNAMYKSGTNAFHGTLFGAWTNHMLQSNNLSQDLINRGLPTRNGVRFVYDGDAEVDGPVIKDRLWFMAHARGWGNSIRAANLFYDANEGLRTPGAPAAVWKYSPNLSKPVNQVEKDRGIGIKFNALLSKKDSVMFSYDTQRNFQDALTGGLLTGGAKLEGNGPYCQNESVWQGTWNRTQSDKLLFQAGLSVVNFDFGSWATKLDLSNFSQCGREPYQNVFINDISLGYSYNGAGSQSVSLSHQMNGRFSVDKIVGPHDFKFGTQWMFGLGGGYRTRTVRKPSQIGGLPVSYTFLNGNPSGLTQFYSDLTTTVNLMPDLGLFAQDQWRLTRKITVSYGARFDMLRESVPSICEPAGVTTPAQCLPALSDSPNWKDLSPRFGIVWDPRGDGKTAIKAGINRYVSGETTGIANDLSAEVQNNSTTRSWKDTNGNFIPDCNLSLSGANGECGALSNQLFGSPTLSTTADPNWVKGWYKRPYDWQFAVTVQRELTSYLSASVGYYRTWFGNQITVNNTYYQPSDYDPYCVPIPADPRIPNSGQQLCGLYDLNTTRAAARLGVANAYGLQKNVVTFAKNYGSPTDIYNGWDALFQFHKWGVDAGGGYNIGNNLQTTATAGGSLISAQNNCYVVYNPQQAHFQLSGTTAQNCNIQPPYQGRFKVNGSYNIPWHKIAVAAVYQNNTGPVYFSNVSYSSATIATSLGRPLAGGVASNTIEVDNPFTQYGPRINQLDVRASKTFAIAESRKLQLNFDLYNITNSNAVLNFFSTYGTYGSATAGARYLQPTQILDGRLAKFSAQFNF